MYRCLLLVFIVSCVQAQNSSPQEIMQQAIAAQQSGHYEQAVRGYRQLLEHYPNIFEIRSNLGASLAGEGLYSEAITEYQRALRLKPNPKVRLNLALAYYKIGNFTHAVQTLQQVHAEMPADLQTVTLLADCYLKLGRNKDVVDLLTPLQSAHPEDRTFIYLLGTALVRDGQAAKGQVIIDQILRHEDSAESHLLMGTAKFMVSDYAGAREDFHKAIELKPTLPEAFAYYGMALLSTGDQAGARKAFEQELKSDPNNFVANLHMGVLLREDQAYEQALKYLHHALEIRPGDAGVRFQIASVESAQNQLPAACRDLEALVKDNPNFIEAHVALATVYFREKRKADGERERAIFAKLNAARSAKNEIAAKPAQ